MSAEAFAAWQQTLREAQAKSHEVGHELGIRAGVAITLGIVEKTAKELLARSDEADAAGDLGKREELRAKAACLVDFARGALDWMMADLAEMKKRAGLEPSKRRE